jgi:hypothetical protein
VGVRMHTVALVVADCELVVFRHWTRSFPSAPC